MRFQRFLLSVAFGLLLTVGLPLTKLPQGSSDFLQPKAIAQTVAQTVAQPVTQPVTQPLLRVEGRLEAGDLRFDEAGSFYDLHSFKGIAGQQVTITLESLEFDPSLSLRDEQGNLIDRSDDIEFAINLNASLTLVLPQTGAYQIRVTSLEVTTGSYKLTVMPSQNGDEPLLSPAALQQVEARRQWRQAEDLRMQGKLTEALQLFQQTLQIYQQNGSRALEAGTLNQIGLVYQGLGQYPEATQFLQQAIDSQRSMGNRDGEAIALNNLGAVYSSTGQYAKALETYEQALDIVRTQSSGDISYEGDILSSQATVLYHLGQYPEALAALEQALRLQQTSPIGILSLGGTATQIGLVYNSLEQYNLALEYLQEAVSLHQKTGERTGEAIALSNIGLVYSHQAEYDLALDYYQQALAIHQETGNLAAAAATLNNLARVYDNLQQPDRAMQQYQQALHLAEQIGDRHGISVVFNNLGFLLGQQQPEVGITFLKQAVNQWEAIRGDLTVLPIEQQQSFTDTVSSAYRYLADLLLQQDRILEAQQVLDLLKVQELDDYLNDVKGNNQTVLGVNLWEAEQQILRFYQQQFKAEDASARAFSEFLNRPEVQTQVAQLQRIAREQRLNPDLLVRLQDNLQGIDQTTALLYPLILADRLELILIRPDAPPLRRSVAVRQADLEQTILQFRNQLVKRSGQTTAAQQLYDWLIRPIAADLSQTATILFAADGLLRYVPLAALHDGNQWLIQQFQINYITAASLTDFSVDSLSNNRVLAGAFSDPSQIYQFAVGGQNYKLSGLKYAGLEISSIAAELPTTALLNQAFSRAAVESQMNQHAVLHLATHAELVAGNPNESFILFGNGDRVTLRQISDWTMPAVDLVVLSACRTAVGGRLGNGEEILGFGYQVQRTGAKAALASLWYVDDSSTQTLMNQFYNRLAQGMSKAAALRQAQLAMLSETPYHWAPFILIGNGLS